MSRGQYHCPSRLGRQQPGAPEALGVGAEDDEGGQHEAGLDAHEPHLVLRAQSTRTAWGVGMSRVLEHRRVGTSMGLSWVPGLEHRRVGMGMGVSGVPGLKPHEPMRAPVGGVRVGPGLRGEHSASAFSAMGCKACSMARGLTELPEGGSRLRPGWPAPHGVEGPAAVAAAECAGAG